MIVGVTGDHLAALRAFLTDDYTAFDRISSRLDEDGSWHGYAVLQGAAFTVAARRRFADGYTAGDIIRFVGKVRAAAHDETGQIDPVTAERLLHSALSGAASTAKLDPNAVAQAMMPLLKTLVAEDHLTGPDLDAFLAESRDEARRTTGY